MLSMDIIAEIRRRHLISGESISAIARILKLSRPTVRKHLHTVEPVAYQRKAQPVPRLGEYRARLESWLETERSLVSVSQTHSPQTPSFQVSVASARQRCGNNSPMRLARWVGRRVSTSFR